MLVVVFLQDFNREHYDYNQNISLSFCEWSYKCEQSFLPFFDKHIYLLSRQLELKYVLGLFPFVEEAAVFLFP